MLRSSKLGLVSCMFSLCGAGLLSGCAASFDVAPSAPTPAAGKGFRGVVHGGQAPIAGAAVYLFAASERGAGTYDYSLLNTTSAGVISDGLGRGYVTTDASGSFNITGDYACPMEDLVYLVAVGGDPGSGTNPAIKEMTTVSSCAALTPASFLEINEVTTVAAVTALSAFIDTTDYVSTSSANVKGLQHAFVTADNLVNMGTGVANATTASGLGAIPVSEIYTLADALAACVNGLATSTACGTLFTATTVGTTVPANTLEAMLSIARHPAHNVATIFGLVTASAPFQPTLPAQYSTFTNTNTGVPSDWTLAIVYTSPDFRDPNYLAIDSQDNIWTVSGFTQVAVQLSNDGVENLKVQGPLYQLLTNNFNQVMTIDESDNVWVDNNSYGVSEISKAGVLLSPAAVYWGFVPGPGTNDADLSSGGPGYPTANYVEGYGGIAVDASNNIFIGSAANELSGVAKTDSNGVGISLWMGGGLSNPTSIALDTLGNVWLANYGNPQASPDTAVKFSATGALLSGATGYPTGSVPLAIAIDHKNNALIANYAGLSITALSNLGVPLPNSPYTGGGLTGPSDIAIDGDGNIWVSNLFGSYKGISEFSGVDGSPLSPSDTGFYPGDVTSQAPAVGVDSSGNVWIADYRNESLNELVGAGAPTVNPLSVATKKNMIGVRP